VLSSVLFLIAVAAFVWSRSLPALLVSSLVAGACSLVLNSATQAMVAMYSPALKYDSRFAALSLVGSAGQVLGGGLVGIMPTVFATNSPATPIFAATTVAAVLIVLLAPGVTGAGRPGSAAAPTADPISTLSILRTPGVTPAIVASLTVLATVDLIGVYLPVLGVERGWSEATVGSLLAVRGIATMGARVFLGRLSRWLGGNRLFVISVMASAVFIGVVALPIPVAGTAALLVVTGGMLGFGQPLSMALVARAAPEGARGMAMSLRMSGNMLGLALLPILTGPLAVAFGAGAVFFASAAALGGVSGLLAATHRTGTREPSSA
jgi:MFS family permease